MSLVKEHERCYRCILSGNVANLHLILSIEASSWHRASCYPRRHMYNNNTRTRATSAEDVLWTHVYHFVLIMYDLAAAVTRWSIRWDSNIYCIWLSAASVPHCPVRGVLPGWSGVGALVQWLTLHPSTITLSLEPGEQPGQSTWQGSPFLGRSFELSPNRFCNAAVAAYEHHNGSRRISLTLRPISSFF